MRGDAVASLLRKCSRVIPYFLLAHRVQTAEKTMVSTSHTPNTCHAFP